MSIDGKTIAEDLEAARTRRAGGNGKGAPAAAPLPTASASDAYGRAAIERELAELGATAEGARNEQLNRSAFSLAQLVAGGVLLDGPTRDALLAVALQIGLPEREALSTITSAWRSGIAQPRTAPERERKPASEPELPSTAGDIPPEAMPPDPDAFFDEANGQPDGEQASEAPAEGVTADGSDLAAAEALVREHGQDMRHLATLGGWHVWNGRWWAHSECGEVERLAQATGRRMLAAAMHDLADATGAGDETAIKRAKQRVADWRRAQSRRGLDAMLILAVSQLGISLPGNAVNADPWTFCCPSGVIDLRTAKVRAHQRGDMITRFCPVVYDPAARSDRWEKFLADATGGDADLAAFLQRAVGYSMTGSGEEEKLFFVHGPAAAGKSTFVEAVKHALGDYATTADFETFLQRQDVGGPRNDIARLAGARFVASIEVDEGKRLAAGLVKMLTGGDTVAARFLYHESFEFRPQCKLWLCANHAPKVRSDDEAMWRRILRVPFAHAVPKEQRDPELKAELLDVGRSGPAILAWAVRGAMAWREFGLGVPAMVEQATEAYRHDQDPLAEFFEQRCEFGPDAQQARRELREAYESWCKECGATPLGAKSFAAGLRQHGVSDGGHVRWNGKMVHTWQGVQLLGEGTDMYVHVPGRRELYD